MNLLGLPLAVPPRAEAFIYRAGGDTISRVSLDGTGVDQSFITGTINPLGVAVDVFWTASHAVGRASLDGTNVESGFSSTVWGRPSEVAVDANHV